MWRYTHNIIPTRCTSLHLVTWVKQSILYWPLNPMDLSPAPLYLDAHIPWARDNLIYTMRKYHLREKHNFRPRQSNLGCTKAREVSLILGKLAEDEGEDAWPNRTQILQDPSMMHSHQKITWSRLPLEPTRRRNISNFCVIKFIISFRPSRNLSNNSLTGMQEDCRPLLLIVPY